MVNTDGPLLSPSESAADALAAWDAERLRPRVGPGRGPHEALGGRNRRPGIEGTKARHQSRMPPRMGAPELRFLMWVRVAPLVKLALEPERDMR